MKNQNAAANKEEWILPLLDKAANLPDKPIFIRPNSPDQYSQVFREAAEKLETNLGSADMNWLVTILGLIVAALVFLVMVFPFELLYR